MLHYLRPHQQIALLVRCLLVDQESDCSIVCGSISMRSRTYINHRITEPQERALGKSLAPRRSTDAIILSEIDNRAESSQEVVDVRIETLLASHGVMPVILF